MMSNVLPLRLTVRPHTTVSELAGETTRRMRHVIRHQRYSVANLQRDFQRIANQRTFGPTINFMPFDYNLRFNGCPATAHNLSNGPVEDLSIGLYDRSDGRDLRIDFDGNPASFSSDRLADLQQKFLRLLAAVGDAERLIGSLDILAAAERAAHSARAGTTPRARSRPATLPALFAAQVPKSPQAVAAVFEHEQPELSRPRCARQPARPSSARARGRPRGGGGAVPGALARDADRAPRHPQGRRRLSAARPRLPARAPGLHARRCARPAAGHPRRAARQLPQPRPASSASTPTPKPSPHCPPPPRKSTSTRKTPPTSSTPQVQQVHQKASWSIIAMWCGS